MAKDGTARGGVRAGSGRKSKALAEKIGTGNPGGRKLTVMELPAGEDLSGEDMPEVKSYMKERQKNGEDFDAADIFEEIWLWLKLVRHEIRPAVLADISSEPLAHIIQQAEFRP